MQKLILTNFQCPGDIVMLTAAIRDLHTCYPNRYITDVRTPWPDLWLNNLYLMPLAEDDPDVRVVECDYPSIKLSNQRPQHFLYGFIQNINEQLGLQITPTRFQGDIHLSHAEKATPSIVKRTTGLDVPYWIIDAGGKYDFTIKWWHFRRWQAIVDEFRDRLLFVQIGEERHYHPPLSGVLDLRGKTSLRDLVHLVYHAAGVLCPVTFLMHLAAAVECKTNGCKSRPCVVVAGGREPSHWEAYPTHQFIHTVGLLPCCADGGCWRSRSVPLGDGDEKDDPMHLCISLVDNLPKCMHLITPAMVSDRIELYLAGAALPQLTATQTRALAPFLLRRKKFPFEDESRNGSISTFAKNRQTTTKKHHSYAKQ